jgi:CCR4-NOT transcription complex subunit 9
MLQGTHVFSHQHHYNPQGEPAWMHQQSHHQQQAVAAAQQQHYNRIAASHNSVGPSISSAHGQDTSMMENVTEENRRTLAFIADLLNEDTREAALLELSKKREQVPELALILWHSFGKFSQRLRLRLILMSVRCHDFTASGDHICLHLTQPVPAHSCSI